MSNSRTSLRSIAQSSKLSKAPTTPVSCNHIFTNGRQCGSARLRGEDFCYYHHPTRRPISQASLDARKTKLGRLSSFTLPDVETTRSIEQAIAEVRQRVAGTQVDPRRARLLMFGLELAFLNLITDRWLERS